MRGRQRLALSMHLLSLSVLLNSIHLNLCMDKELQQNTHKDLHPADPQMNFNTQAPAAFQKRCATANRVKLRPESI